MISCWKCGKGVDEKITFRSFCEACQSDLHCCKNCTFYKPGQPNDCMIPGTDFIRDREKANFCEEFRLLGKKAPDAKNDAKKRFDDLFK